MPASKLYPEDNLSVEKIKAFLTATSESEGDTWSDLLPSFQRICVEWLVDELEHTQRLLKTTKL